ncbi:MAG: right-handed parallel beta-helix repeat-containing protein [Bryobacterales bacterium]|nr:right-handed parallel beta-helix repeat-containing protein [Bryobacteraceae bacterium]MDW8131349.1 right-handed parallel beta-helix repeat-containing protein [Bryobacterales bacterium]
MKLLLVVLLAPLAILSEDRTIPREVTTYPTIVNLSVEWKIEGDDNLNGVVRVYYRVVGEERWREALPLVRVPAGNSGARTTPTFSWENRHSGSIFDLRPDTEYEVRLELEDPDGGSAERIVRARTRGVPRAAAGAPVKQANALTLKEAEAAARPGDVLLLAPGYYGEFTCTRDGEPGRPIVLRGRREGGLSATFDGVSLRNRRHVILENVTVYGTVDLLGAEEVAVRHCTVVAKYGIVANRPPGARNCYIADNVVTWFMPWVPEGMGSESVYGGPANVGEGIQITGPGNVICHNRVRGYRDCISTMEDRGAHEQHSIDIYNNDVEVCVDDGIEADFSMGNCRIMRNRLTNCFIGLSSQPSLGGPTYFIRNVMYNLIETAFKLSRGSIGNLLFHNTAVKVGDGFRVPHGPEQYARSVFRNNLCLGGTGGGQFGRYTSGSGRAFYTPETDPSNDFDWNGIGTHGTPFLAQLGPVRFNSFAELLAWPGLQRMILVDLSVFEAVEFPDPPVPERRVADLRLRPASAATDAGIRLANVNDNFHGAAPDLGAYESGEQPPHYGPRPEGVDESTAPSSAIETAGPRRGK